MSKFKRRIGPSPQEINTSPTSENTCPDIWELESGDFAIIGADRTSELTAHLPSDAGCGDHERIVVIPRLTLVSAKNDIP